MKRYLVLFLCFCTLSSFSQNLVINGDFELYDTCPNNASFPGADQLRYCSNWRLPTFSTADYFNRCAVGTPVAIPANPLGYQEPESGDGFCGLIPMAQENGWVEYIQGEILPLEKDKFYKLSIYVNLANESINSFDKIGVYISEDAYTDFSVTETLSWIKPQFVSPSGEFINDTLNWINFHWYFIANGSERYLTIGKFDEVSSNDFKEINPVGTTFSYLFIDDVSIERADVDLTVSNVFTPNNDGINDYWEFPYKSAGETEIIIFNRWGNLIRKEELENFSWDGTTSQGQVCEQGVYYYLIKTEYDEFHGFVELLR